MLRPSSLRLLISSSSARNLPRRFPPLSSSSPSRTSIFTPRHAPAIPLPRNQTAIFSTSSRCFIDPNLIQPDLRKEREERRQAKLEPHPDKVSTTSTLRPLTDMGPGEASAQDGDIDMMKGIRSDLKTVKETFALRDVPREVYYFGGAGLIPYVTTSVATMFMAWDIEHAKHTGYAVLFSRETAESIIQFAEPLQVALGAVILSFLGAIHWGLEFANYGGTHPYRRYTIGILAPVLAWPTIMLPFDFALLVQFVGFTGMYFADVQATTWGWAPRWYMTYRFVLTFVVGACIITTLIGRGKIGDAITPTQRAEQQLAALFHDPSRGPEQEKQRKAEEKHIAHKKADKKAEEDHGEQRESGKKAAEGKQGVQADEKQRKEEEEKKGEQKGEEEEEEEEGGEKDTAMKG